MTNSETPVYAQKNPKLEGIDGWLLLPLLQLVVAPIYECFDVAKLFRHQNFTSNFSVPGIQATMRGIAFELLALAISLLTITFVFLGLFCLIKFLRKNRTTPHLMVIWYGASIALVALVAIQMAVDPDLFEKTITPGIGFGREMFRLAAKGIVSGVMISYFETSVRVRNTFVR